MESRFLHRRSLLVALTRGVAVAVGGFTLLNLLGDIRTPGFDANAWWIDVSFLPHAVQVTLLAATGLVLLAHGLRPFAGTAGRMLTRGLIVLVAFITLMNAINFWKLTAMHVITPGFKIPLSAFLCAALLLILVSTRPSPGAPAPRRVRDGLLMGLALVLCALLFPLAQMVCFGKTDYRRNADVIVIFGARGYADGRLSQALEDRVRTGCQLYNAGLAPYVIMTGGPGDGPFHETDAMRARALQLGVPDSAILIDRGGLNTEDSVENTSAVFQKSNMHSILAVSHFYHLPRIKITYQRVAALATAEQKESFAIYTVPAEEPLPLVQLPRYMLREIAALWVYYLRPLTGH